LNDFLYCAIISEYVVEMMGFMTKLPKLRLKYAEFIDNYFEKDVEFNATEAYHRTYPNASRETARRNGHLILTRADIQAHIEARFAERRMGTNEAVDILTQQARGNIGIFFKPVDEWTFYPLATDEILEVKEVEPDEEGENEKQKGKEKTAKIMYRVRRLVLDIDKVTDPKYSHLIKEFSDRGRDGMSIKLHDPQRASDQVLRVLGAYKDKVEHTGPSGGPITVIEVVKTYEKNDVNSV
jgi:phage terminase small subunit